jgi:hypothetical protein
MYEAMRNAKERVEDEILTFDGVVGVDIGYKEINGQQTDTLAIRVLVERKLPLDEIEENQRIPRIIQDNPTDVIERGRVHFMQDTGRYDPLVGGISGGTCGGVLGTGTLGAVVRDVSTGRLGMLSNWHVLVGGVSGSTGLSVAQPGPFDNGSCSSDAIGTVTRSAINEDVDAAVLLLNGARPAINAIQDFGTLVAPGTLNVTSNMIGWPVVKRGRTTGLTYGTIDTIDASFEMWDGGVRRIFKRQIGIWRNKTMNWSFGRPGDSGSVVVDITNRRVIGLYFASSTPPFTFDNSYGYANRISSVLFSLGVQIFAPKPKEKDKEKDKEDDKFRGGEKLMRKEIEDFQMGPGGGGQAENPLGQSLDASYEAGPVTDRLAKLEKDLGELQHFIGGQYREGTSRPSDQSASSSEEGEGSGDE